MSSPLGPWSRDSVLLLHIFILLLVWFAADRCKFYFIEIPRYWYLGGLYLRSWWREFRSKPR